MGIKINGKPDDLINRCDGCNYCIFEEILKPEQRKIKVLDLEVPEKHMHRSIIEQICGHQYDEVCHMKYAAMRAVTDDRTAVQIRVVKNYIWDQGKRYKKEIPFSEAIQKWTMPQFLGREIKESRAGRFKEIWDRGIRIIIIDGKTIENQILTADFIYEAIMLKLDNYDNMLKLLDRMVKEHRERDAI